MDLTTITVSQFKTRFYRDFNFANQNPNQEVPVPPNVELVQDIDIQNAFSDAQVLLNQALFSGTPNSDANITSGYLYLSAHCLCLNIKASDSGINSGGTGGFPVSSRSVGSVSETYQVPDAYKDDPILAQYAQTAYGQKYLAMVLPYLRGNMLPIFGGAHAAGEGYPGAGWGFPSGG
jgi:Protein of unknown function (DUF4054)